MKSSAILTTVMLVAAHHVTALPIGLSDMDSPDADFSGPLPTLPSSSPSGFASTSSSASTSTSTSSNNISMSLPSSGSASTSSSPSSAASSSFASSSTSTDSASSAAPSASANTSDAGFSSMPFPLSSSPTSSSSASGSGYSSSSASSSPTYSSASPSSTPTPTSTPNTTQILQLTLTLANLESIFFSQALANYTASDFADAGLPNGAYGRFAQIAQHEAMHVDILNQTLGNASFAACNYSFPYTDPWSFAALAGMLESMSNAAYLGSTPYLANDTAALNITSSILSTTARQSSWINSAILMSDPWSGSFDTPLSPSLAYTLAQSFTTLCPPSHPTLPFTSSPNLTVTTGDGSSTFSPGSNVTLTYDNSTAGSNPQYLAFFSGLNTTFANITSDKQATIPKGLQGFMFTVVTTSPNGSFVSDKSTVAGPAVLSFAFGSNATNV
ncbi:hypothetical protein EW145_g7705 [Phellinidium pouzarii]|uniref:Uncharacterized protein n=1 Tax=Phellinidium pouzarii TaxID=167371 RepID=A0A4S4KFP1_9AGAM|nr:hypothetical protein EW145_g7705 [Phellinidium pouzarii]